VLAGRLLENRGWAQLFRAEEPEDRLWTVKIMEPDSTK
jgi:hypothetical protein